MSHAKDGACRSAGVDLSDMAIYHHLGMHQPFRLFNSRKYWADNNPV